MKLLPDVATAYIDPFRVEKTLVMNFSIVDPFTDEPYSRDPRNIAAKAEAYLKSTGIADTAYFGAEAEFFLFDDVRFKTSANESLLLPRLQGRGVEHRQGRGGRQPGLQAADEGRLLPGPPVDHFADIRDEICLKLKDVGLTVERSHHEVASGGQQEINYRFNTLLHSGDDMMKFKYVVKNTAWHNGKTATFMPKPIFGDNGSGMHTHQSLWKDGEPLFYDERGYGGLSDLARWYIGGLLKHAPSLLAFTNPTVNSYHRLVPGYEAPVNLVYSARNRSAVHPHPDRRARRRRPSASSSGSRTRPATPTSPSPRS
jgi:glutamine synthetase